MHEPQLNANVAKPGPSGHPPHADLDLLLSLCADDDRAAFAALYDLTASRVYGLALRLIRNPSHSEEVAQEVFLEMWRDSGRFDPQKGSARSWIFTIAHRKAVDRVRHVEASRRRDQAHWEGRATPSYDSTSEQAVASIEGQRVRAALDRLPLAQRQAVDLAYFGGLTHTEIAARLHVPLGTAKSRIRDGLLCMRDDMQQNSTSTLA